MSDFTLGQHDQAIETLMARTARIERDVSAIHTILAERRGERRVAVWLIGAVAGVLGAAVTAAVKLAARLL